MWPDGSAVKRVAIDHVRGFDSRLCLFFLHMENGIRVGFLSFLLSKYSYRNPTNGSSSEIPIGLSRIGLRQKLPGTCHFMSIWLVKISIGMWSDSDRNRWGSVKTSFGSEPFYIT